MEFCFFARVEFARAETKRKKMKEKQCLAVFVYVLFVCMFDCVGQFDQIDVRPARQAKGTSSVLFVLFFEKKKHFQLLQTPCSFLHFIVVSWCSFHPLSFFFAPYAKRFQVKRITFQASRESVFFFVPRKVKKRREREK